MRQRGREVTIPFVALLRNLIWIQLAHGVDKELRPLLLILL